jgi:hypothetical protein
VKMKTKQKERKIERNDKKEKKGLIYSLSFF